MATCQFREGGQVCGELAIDEVGISPPGGGQVREIPACERHLQSMVETYFSKAPGPERGHTQEATRGPVEAAPEVSAPTPSEALVSEP
jgi:hypothetical protein